MCVAGKTPTSEVGKTPTMGVLPAPMFKLFYVELALRVHAVGDKERAVSVCVWGGGGMGQGGEGAERSEEKRG